MNNLKMQDKFGKPRVRFMLRPPSDNLDIALETKYHIWPRNPKQPNPPSDGPYYILNPLSEGGEENGIMDKKSLVYSLWEYRGLQALVSI